MTGSDALLQCLTNEGIDTVFGYPGGQLPAEEQTLKGFNWQPEKRPADRYAVTPVSLRPRERLR